ncbi:EGY1 [Scenedesmus sp. PABB004]|nr:EGY1 [Scenedesmus sp. PABB004]
MQRLAALPGQRAWPAGRARLARQQAAPCGRAVAIGRGYGLALARPAPCAVARRAGSACRATGVDGSSSPAPSATAPGDASPGSALPGAVPEERLRNTLADLDALLGIQEEPAEADAKAASLSSDAANMELLQSAVTAEVQKLAGSKADPKATSEIERDMTDQMRKIVERAKQMTEEEGADKVDQKAALQQEFEQLLNIFFTGDNSMDKADIKRLKESGVFGPLTFWVTEIRNLEEGGNANAGSGVLVRGNLRTDRLTVFRAVCDKVKELFGGKYEVLMIEDPEAQAEGDAPPPRPSSSAAAGGKAVQEPRVAFQVVLASDVTPPQTNGWKVTVAGILLLLLVASSVQLSLVANITKLPKETLEYFANPDNLNAAGDALPPGLAGWDPAPYLASAVPIALSVVGVNFVHELGHRIAAALRGVKLGPTFFVPNLQIGSFGGITPLNSLLKDRSQLWDVAAAGPLAGVAASAALLAIGLSQSHDGGLPQELLVPVPTQLFQGSLLLGSVTRLALGPEAMARADVLISPLVIAGWCGLITNALNLLPVGCLDGGRMVQSAFGLQALSLSAFFTYCGLGLGLLGSSLSLPFGLYVLICQRSAEKYIQDSVSPVAGAKQTATAVAVLTAVLVLVPMAPEVAQSVGVGAASPNLFIARTAAAGSRSALERGCRRAGRTRDLALPRVAFWEPSTRLNAAAGRSTPGPTMFRPALAALLLAALALAGAEARRLRQDDGYLQARMANKTPSKGNPTSRSAITDYAAESTSNSQAPGTHRLYAPPARRSYATANAVDNDVTDNRNMAVQTRVRSAQDTYAPRGPNRSNGAPNMPAVVIGGVSHAQTYEGATSTSSSDSFGVNRGGRGTAISGDYLTSRQPVLRRARPGQSWATTMESVNSAALVGRTDGPVVLAQAMNAVAMSHMERKESERSWSALGAIKELNSDLATKRATTKGATR